MSQSRARKTRGLGNENGNRARPTAKESGDSAPAVPHQTQTGNIRHSPNRRRKTKIPKSIRYDLDNALVSLCDVWFEEIKPYLVRNNIKLHVDRGRTGSGDYRGPEPRAAPGCSHLDTGAASDHQQLAGVSSVVCCPTRRPASKTLCRKPSTSPRSRQSPPRLARMAQKKSRISKSPKGSRKAGSSYSHTRPHLCRSCQRANPPLKTRRVQTAPFSYRANEYSKKITDNLDIKAPIHKISTYNKKTQTKVSYIRSQLYDSQRTPISYTMYPVNANVAYPKKITKKLLQQLQQDPNKNSVIPKPPNSNIPATMVSKLPQQTNAHNLTKEKSFSKIKCHRNLESRNAATRKGGIKREKEDPSIAPRPPDNDTILRSKCRFWKYFSSTNSAKDIKENQKQRGPDDNIIYDKELIDIISSKNDKRLRVLYKSPVREDFQSVLNLLPSPEHQNVKAKSGKTNTLLPWK